ARRCLPRPLEGRVRPHASDFSIEMISITVSLHRGWGAMPKAALDVRTRVSGFSSPSRRTLIHGLALSSEHELKGHHCAGDRLAVHFDNSIADENASISGGRVGYHGNDMRRRRFGEANQYAGCARFFDP